MSFIQIEIELRAFDGERRRLVVVQIRRTFKWRLSFDARSLRRRSEDSAYLELSI